MVMRMKLSDLAQIAENRRKNNFDCIIAFVGARGDGKSTSGDILCHKISKMGTAKKYTRKRDLVYSREKLLKALGDTDRIINADEMINSAYKREFYNVDQIDLVKILNMYRDHRHVLIICIPNFWDLDKPLRDLVRLRVDVIRRGFGAVHAPRKQFYSNDPWDTKLNQKIEQTFYGRDGVYRPKFHKLTTFSGYIKLPKMTEQSYKKYQEVKDHERMLIQLQKEGKEYLTPHQQNVKMKIEQRKSYLTHLLVDIRAGKHTMISYVQDLNSHGVTRDVATRYISNQLLIDGDTKRLVDYFGGRGPNIRTTKKLLNESIKFNKVVVPPLS